MPLSLVGTLFLVSLRAVAVVAALAGLGAWLAASGKLTPPGVRFLGTLSSASPTRMVALKGGAGVVRASVAHLLKHLFCVCGVPPSERDHHSAVVFSGRYCA